MKLTIDSDTGHHLTLMQQNGRLTVIHCSKDMEMVAERWTTLGLTEVVRVVKQGKPVSSRSRRTPPGHPKFLSRAAEFLERNFQFRVELTEA